MRLERLNHNRIKIYLTFDDLYERGLTKDDIWKDSIKWQYFFHEMLEEANDMFDLEIHGSVAVEIFSMKAQGMVMILTMNEEESQDEELLAEGFWKCRLLLKRLLTYYMSLPSWKMPFKQQRFCKTPVSLGGHCLVSKINTIFIFLTLQQQRKHKQQQSSVNLVKQALKASIL